MRKILLLAILVLFTSCTAEPIEERAQPQATTVALCGQVFTASTLFTTGSPSTFIGVRYDFLLTTPYFDGTTTWTKAFVILNDAQNTPILAQYWTNPASIYCGNVPLANLYN